MKKYQRFFKEVKYNSNLKTLDDLFNHEFIYIYDKKDKTTPIFILENYGNTPEGNYTKEQSSQGQETVIASEKQIAELKRYGIIEGKTNQQKWMNFFKKLIANNKYFIEYHDSPE